LKASIIIVNFKTPEVLRDCIESVFQYENSGDFEIIIVDNGSGDNSGSIIKELTEKHKNIRAVYLDEQKSFSYANNRGIEISKGDYILIMNPDIIFEYALINRLIQFLNSNKDTAAIAPALTDVDGKFQKYYYLRYPTIRQFIFFHSLILRFFYKNPYFINRFLIDSNINFNEKKIYYTNQIPGAFFFTSKEIFNEFGLLDENFMLFFEDVDISYRIRKKYKLAVDTRLHVKHLGGESFRKIEWWVYGRFNASMIYFFKKHYSKSRYLTLKYLARTNAYCMLFIEYILKVFGKKNDFRIKKYKNFLILSKDI
jgi:GT2 family glycosyltransferase